jgi:hypothetical protein
MGDHPSRHRDTEIRDIRDIIDVNGGIAEQQADSVRLNLVLIDFD